MEKKIIKYLQEEVVNHWKEAIEDGDDFGKDFYNCRWLNCKRMAEYVLGKEVTIKHWEVIVK